MFVAGLQKSPVPQWSLLVHCTHWPFQKIGVGAVQFCCPWHAPPAHVCPTAQSPLSLHCTHVPPSQMGVDPPHAGVHADAHAPSHTCTWFPLVTQLPPPAQAPSTQRGTHALSAHAMPAPHSQSVAQLAHWAVAASQALLLGLHASPLGQPSFMQPSQRKFDGTQLPPWQSQPVSQSVLLPHGGRQLEPPPPSGTHFQGAPPQASMFAQWSQAAAVDVDPSHWWLTVLQVCPVGHPAVSQPACGHSAPWHGRHEPASQTSLAPQSAWPFGQVLPPPPSTHSPLLHSSPAGHCPHVRQPHSTTAQDFDAPTVMHAWFPAGHSASVAHGTTSQKPDAPQICPKAHESSPVHGVACFASSPQPLPVSASAPRATTSEKTQDLILDIANPPNGPRRLYPRMQQAAEYTRRRARIQRFITDPRPPGPAGETTAGPQVAACEPGR